MGGEKIESASHEVHDTERVSESAVFSPLVGEHCEPELLDAAEPLKLRGVYQLDDQGVLRHRVIERDHVMKRVSVVSSRQPKSSLFDASTFFRACPVIDPVAVLACQLRILLALPMILNSITAMQSHDITHIRAAHRDMRETSIFAARKCAGL